MQYQLDGVKGPTVRVTYERSVEFGENMFALLEKARCSRNGQVTRNDHYRIIVIGTTCVRRTSESPPTLLINPP